MLYIRNRYSLYVICLKQIFLIICHLSETDIDVHMLCIGTEFDICGISEVDYSLLRRRRVSI